MFWEGSACAASKNSGSGLLAGTKHKAILKIKAVINKSVFIRVLNMLLISKSHASAGGDILAD